MYARTRTRGQHASASPSLVEEARISCALRIRSLTTRNCSLRSWLLVMLVVAPTPETTDLPSASPSFVMLSLKALNVCGDCIPD